MTCDEARRLDRAGERVSAWAAYDECLERHGAEPDLETLLDAAILCWELTDPGVGAAHHISAEQLEGAERRCRELLARARERNPESSEPRFWRQYTRWLSLGEPFEPDACRELLEKDPTSLTPNLYLMMSGEIERDSVAIRELAATCQRHGTSRSRYILSVIGAAQR